ncbi:MAG: transposase [Candidatus Saccharimonadales bacterium]
MPSRNIIKVYAARQFYHVYNRGVAKQAIFMDARDKKHFIKILRRHLDAADDSTKNDGVIYRKFDNDLELLCYCLMGNHFHLLFYLDEDTDALRGFMQSILTAYTMYFNKRHKRVGPLFEGVFKASRITNDGYLLHITRYIHLNPRTYKTYDYSSLPYYLGRPAPAWLKPTRILELFEGDDYLQFLEDYEDQAATLEAIKHELANNP